MDRPEQQVDVAAAAVVVIGRGAGADGDRQHRAPADEAAVLEPLLAGVDRAIDEHPVDPALQHRRRQVPPHRILQDQEVGAVEVLDLALHRIRNRRFGGGVALLPLHVEALRVQALPIVL
jgi:hypothetical protein